MKNLQEFLKELGTAKPKHTEKKIEQATRNNYRKMLIERLLEVLKEGLENDTIKVVRTRNGIGIAIDNETIGWLPIEVTVMFKDLDFDVLEEAELYQQELKDKTAEEEKKAQAKKEKIAQDKKEQELKKQLRDCKTKA